MLILNEDDIQQLITLREAVDVLRAAFAAQDAGQATNRPRERVRMPGGAVTMHMLGAALQTEGVIGFKAYTSARSKVRFMVALFAGDTGRLLCMMEADKLGQIRTGAASGLATDLMARHDTATVGVFGAGYQAETQLEALCAVRQVRHALVHSRSEGKRWQFAETMSQRLGIDVRAASAPQDAAQADVIITATTSRTPVLERDWLRPGTHINAIGSNNLARRELPDEAVRDADAVVVDSREQALKEAADIVMPIERGWLTWERVWELREVVSGARQGRPSEDAITLFKSLGLGLEDIAVGAYVYKKALHAGVGREVSFLD